MPQCLFCKKECEKPSDEHVFPAALGGNLVIPAGACTECNNSFSKAEQLLTSELAPIRFIFQIPDRYGKVPQVTATARTASREYQARVRGDGTVVLKPVVTEEKDASGRREFVHRFLTDEQKERLRQQALESGHDFVENTEPGDPEQAEIHIGGDLKVIGSLEGLRAVAKIAYVGLAYRVGPRLALSDAFDKVREFIRNGQGESPASLFIHEGFLKACQQGPHQHALIIAGRHDRKRVDVIVRLFGGLCYFVSLSDSYQGADFCDTVVYDAYRGELNGTLLAHQQAELLQTEDVATSKHTVWGNVAASGEMFCNFLDDAIQGKIARQRESANKQSQ
jgi:hypothetical protein